MTDLVTWLRAQLDEDERVARQARPGPWSYDGNPSATVVAGKGGAGPSLVACRSFNWPTDTASAHHIARHDPARVLAEVDAQRRILDEYEPAASAIFTGIEASASAILEPVVRLLALPYADRPGYDAEWRPEGTQQ